MERINEVEVTSGREKQLNTGKRNGKRNEKKNEKISIKSEEMNLPKKILLEKTLPEKIPSL